MSGYAHVRNGSIASFSQSAGYFRSTLNFGHVAALRKLTLWARSRDQEGAGIRPRSETANAISSKPASENQIIAYRM